MKNLEVLEYKNQSLSEREVLVAEECILHFKIEHLSFDVIISPSDIKSFVYGNLFSEGFIKKKREVLSYSERRKEDIIEVKVDVENLEKRIPFFSKNYNIIWTECGSLPEIQKRKSDLIRPLKPKFKLHPKAISELQKRVIERCERYRKTRAYHYSFILDERLNFLHSAYDIGRHNACDKVCGKLLLDEGVFEDKVLLTTGRVSSDIVLKALRCRIPILISLNVPLLSAVKIARSYNLSLIGFLRGRSFKIYSNFEILS
ncbi:MAG: formate dehydrogenase accessory sulfurtransferase FdhD [Candidatus Methanofastidiosia archaeon]